MELDQILERLERPRRRQPTHEMVASVLREAIITGHLRANEPLPQDEIAAQLRVSHIPVREALRQLESEGLVTYQPNRGATVSALTSEEIREIYEIRVILETAAIRRAATRLTPLQLAAARALLDRAERTQGGAQWGVLDVEFHEAIYGLDDRPRLQELITGLLRRVDRYWLSHGLMLKHRETFDREHRGLLEALERRDGDAAAVLLERHLIGAAGHLIHEMKSIEAIASGTEASRSIG